MINLHDTARKITALFLYFTIVVFFLLPFWAYTYGIYFEDMSLRFFFIENIKLLSGLTSC